MNMQDLFHLSPDVWEAGTDLQNEQEHHAHNTNNTANKNSKKSSMN